MNPEHSNPEQAAPVTEISLTLNGETVTRAVPSHRLLVDFIRDDAGLTGTHQGCDTSQCGACVVHVDGKPVKSCAMFAVQVDGAEVSTIESIGDGDNLSAMQAAFRECHGLQCGFCTPGMVMSALALVAENPAPTRDEVKRGLEGNICRCTGYQNIVDAVIRGAAAMRGGW